jgi:hypothetical protein
MVSISMPVSELKTLLPMTADTLRVRRDASVSAFVVLAVTL